jgi:hypothetical protein
MSWNRSWPKVLELAAEMKRLQRSARVPGRAGTHLRYQAHPLTDGFWLTTLQRQSRNCFFIDKRGTPRELRGAYLEESDPVPPQSRLQRFLNASSRPLALCAEQWNEWYEAQWRPMKRNGVPYQLDLMCRNATSFQKRARRVGSIDLEALLLSSGRSVPDRAGPPRPPKARDRERVSSLLQSVHQKTMSASRG